MLPESPETKPGVREAAIRTGSGLVQLPVHGLWEVITFWPRAPEYRDAVSTLESVLCPVGATTDAGAAVYPTEEL